MLFNSPTFIIFFICVFALYWGLRARVPQNFLLLVASYVFYGAWSWKFLSLLIASTLVDYVAGRLIGAAPSPRSKRVIMLVSVTANLVLSRDIQVSRILRARGVGAARSNGLSGEPSRARDRAADRNFLLHLSNDRLRGGCLSGKIAGRAQSAQLRALRIVLSATRRRADRTGRRNLLPQFRRERTWRQPAFESGLQLAVWGLFKKIVIADNLAPFVNVVYADPSAFAGKALVTATIFFAFQIYCDFSGYTDTARGVARMLGFELIKNFDHPYFSRTPSNSGGAGTSACRNGSRTISTTRLPCATCAEAAGRANTRRTSLP